MHVARFGRPLSVALAVTCLLAALPVTADPAQTQNGVFVSYSPGSTTAAIMIQQGTVLRAYVIDPNALVQEQDGTQAPKAVTFADLAQGEPVVLHLTAAGIVNEVDAPYETVYARLVTSSNGYVVTTSGASYKLVGTAVTSANALQLGTFLRMRVDPQTSTAFDLAASKQPFAGGPLAAPVAVTFVVNVPTNTPPSDIVYLTSDASNWVANAVRMSSVAADRWTATITLGQGASLKYKYTRGSWPTVESNQAGIVIQNRTLLVPKSGSAQTVNDTVARWSDLPS